MKSPFENPAVLYAIVEHMVEGIIVIDEKSIIRAANPSTEHILGYGPGELLGKPLEILLPSNYASRHQGDVNRFVASDVPRVMGKGREVTGIHKDGHEVPLEIGISHVKMEDGHHYMIGVLRDVSERRQAEEELQYMAMHDQLTGLANRMSFRIQLHKAVIDATRYKNRAFALLYCDLVRFKQANDKLGHQAGDVILKIVAERLKRTARETDVVGRMGGDEFLVLAQETRKEGAEVLAKRLIKEVEVPLEINNTRISVGVSIGIVLFPEDGQDATILLNHADQAMYRTKGTGKSAYQFFSDVKPAAVTGS